MCIKYLVFNFFLLNTVQHTETSHNVKLNHNEFLRATNPMRRAKRCVGDMLELYCESGERIVVTSIKFGRSEQCKTDPWASILEEMPGVCIRDSPYFHPCSGLQICSVKAPSYKITACGYNDYVDMQYYCIAAESLHNICTKEPLALTTLSGYIATPAYPTKIHMPTGDTCRLYIELPAGHTIHLYIVDSFTIKPSQELGVCQLMLSLIDSGEMVGLCLEGVYYRNQLIYSSKGHRLMVQLRVDPVLVNDNTKRGVLIHYRAVQNQNLLDHTLIPTLYTNEKTEKYNETPVSMTTAISTYTTLAATTTSASKQYEATKPAFIHENVKQMPYSNPGNSIKTVKHHEGQEVKGEEQDILFEENYSSSKKKYIETEYVEKSFHHHVNRNAGNSGLNTGNSGSVENYPVSKQEIFEHAEVIENVKQREKDTNDSEQVKGQPSYFHSTTENTFNFVFLKNFDTTTITTNENDLKKHRMKELRMDNDEDLDQGKKKSESSFQNNDSELVNRGTTLLNGTNLHLESTEERLLFNNKKKSEVIMKPMNVEKQSIMSWGVIIGGSVGLILLITVITTTCCFIWQNKYHLCHKSHGKKHSSFTAIDDILGKAIPYPDVMSSHCCGDVNCNKGMTRKGDGKDPTSVDECELSCSFSDECLKEAEEMVMENNIYALPKETSTKQVKTKTQHDLDEKPNKDIEEVKIYRSIKSQQVSDNRINSWVSEQAGRTTKLFTITEECVSDNMIDSEVNINDVEEVLSKEGHEKELHYMSVEDLLLPTVTNKAPSKPAAVIYSSVDFEKSKQLRQHLLNSSSTQMVYRSCPPDIISHMPTANQIKPDSTGQTFTGNQPNQDSTGQMFVLNQRNSVLNVPVGRSKEQNGHSLTLHI